MVSSWAALTRPTREWDFAVTCRQQKKPEIFRIGRVHRVQKSSASSVLGEGATLSKPQGHADALDLDLWAGLVAPHHDGPARHRIERPRAAKPLGVPKSSLAERRNLLRVWRCRDLAIDGNAHHDLLVVHFEYAFAMPCQRPNGH
jgi:hypothetical protein